MIGKRGVRFLASALFLFAALSCCCSAALVYNKFIMPNETATVQGNTFTFTLSPDWQKLYFSGNGTQSIIAVLNCKDTTFYTICFNGTRYNVSNGWGTADRFNGEVPQIYVRIYDRAPAITITRWIDNSSLLLGEETTVHVQIKNSGNADLYNVEFTDHLPTQLLILAYPKLNRDGNTLSWKGGIDIGKNKSFEYDVKAIAPFDVKSKAKVVFEYANKSKEVESKEVRIRVIEPVNVSYGFTKNNLSIYENTSFYVNFTNTDPVYPINITLLRIYPPDGVIVRSYSSDMEKLNDGSYRWTKDIAKGKMAGVEVNLSSTYYSTYFIKAELKYLSHGTEFEKTLSKNLTFYIAKLTPLFWLKHTTVRAGEENRVEIGLKNSNKKVSFKDIMCSFEGPLTGNTAKSYALIGADTEMNVFSMNFTKTENDVGKTFPITVNCNYKSLNQQQFYASGTYNITVKNATGLSENRNATVNNSATSQIRFGSAFNETGATTRDTTATTTATTTTTLAEKEQSQPNGVLKFFAAIGHFVRNIFG